MEIQKSQGHEPPASEVVAALTDFARLSRRVGSSGFATPDMHDAIARELLEHVLTLCGAARGALLITTHYRAEPQQSTVASLSNNKKVFPTCTLHEMSEEDVFALLATFSAERGDIQEPPDISCWTIWRLSLSLPSLFQQDAYVDQDGKALGSSSLSPYPKHTIQAFFFFGWTETDDISCAPAIEKGHAVLPMVADAVSSVIVSMLLAERVHDLEASADRKALREMELLKAELLATVSHELRSPLSSIKGYAATLLRHERRISREERHEFLVAITDASNRLEAVINRLLEMSQLETGSISIERTPVNLAHLVREAITAVEQRFGEAESTESTYQTESHITFTLRLEDNERRPTSDEPVIQADRHRLREVLDNLLENAVIYSPEGGVVEVGIRPVGTSGSSAAFPAPSQEMRNGGKAAIPALQNTPAMIEIWVQDNGIGIPPKHLERIFERFHRVDTRLIREVNGLGLGLAICRRIVDLHNGTIWAESTPGEGSTFHILLPVYDGASSIAQTPKG